MAASSLFQWIGSLSGNRQQQRQQQRRRSSSRRLYKGIPEPVLSTIDEDKEVLVFEDDYDFDYNRRSSEMNHFVLMTLLVVLSMALAARIGTLTGATLPENTNRSNSYSHSYSQIRNIESVGNHDNTHNKNTIGVMNNRTRTRGLKTTTRTTKPPPPPPPPLKQISPLIIDGQVPRSISSSSNRYNRAASHNWKEFMLGFGEQVATATSASALPVEDENAVPSRTQILPLTNNNKKKPPSRQNPHSADDITNAFMAKKMEEGLRRRASPRRR